MSAEKAPTIDRSNKRREKNPGKKVEADKGVKTDAVENKAPTKEEVRKWEKKIFKAAVVDTTRLVEAQARDIGDHRMAESKDDRTAEGFKEKMSRLWKRIWNHNIAQEYYRQKEIAAAKGEILGSKNLYVGQEGDTGAAHKEAMSAIVDRFTSEYKNDVLTQEERDSKKQASTAVNSKVKDLIKEYAGGTMSKQAFEEQKKRILKEADKNYGADGKMHADNLAEIAEEVRDAVAHGTKLAEIDFEVQLEVGEARESLKTEQEKHTFDKILNTMGKTKIGQAAISLGAVGLVAAVYSAAKFATVGLGKKAAKWAGFGAGAVAAGGIEALKENTRMKRDRAQHIRERAMGMKFTEADMERRQEMEKNMYETRGARSISNQLEADIARVASGEINAAEFNKITANLADLEARIKLGDTRKIDLVSYSSFSTVERERTDLDLARARLKVALRKGIEKKTVAYTRTENFDAYLASVASLQAEQLLGGETGVNKKDEIFNSLKRKKVATAFLKGTFISAGVGLAFQEVSSVIHADTDNVVSGTLKSIRNHLPGGIKDTINAHTGPMDHHATALEGLRRMMFHTGPRMPFGTGHELILDSQTHIQLPDGVQTISNAADHTVDIIRDGEVIASHVHLDTDPLTGDLTEAAKNVLKEHDIYSSFANVGTQRTVTEHASDWVAKNLKGLHHVAREWMGNDTPMYPDPNHPGHLLGADLNELRTHWAGAGGTGIAANGHFQLNVQHMTNDGSFQDGVSVAAANERSAGALKALLSVTKDSQHYVIEVPIDKAGLIDIDPNSDAGKMLFENVNGHAVYTGAFLEIAKPNGTTPDGREIMQVLGTHIGTDHANDISVIEGSISHNVKLDVPDAWDYDTPFPIPVLARRPLERGAPGTPEPRPVPIPSPENPDPMPYYMDYRGGNTSEEDLARFKAVRSKTLLENPYAKLDQYKEVETYLEKQGPVYMKKVRKMAAEMGEMRKECKLTISIPAAGHQEGKNIYESLKNYSMQTANPEEFEIAVFVNHPDVDKEGKPVTPDETLNEIERFKKDFPNINIRVAYEVLPEEEAKIGHIRKLLSDAILVRQHARGIDAPDLIMVSNDADNKGIDPRYIKTFIDKFEKNPQVDGMLGQLDWDPESYQKIPAIQVGTRLFQYLSIIGRSRTDRMVSSGANSAYRASIFAAIGGYNDTKKGGEDIEIGQAIIAARDDDKKRFAFAGTETRLFTSSRRAIHALAAGLAPIEQWIQGFSAHDDEIRKLTLDTKGHVDYENKDTLAKLKKSFEFVINRTLEEYERGEVLGKESAFYKKAIGMLGIKYKLDAAGNVVITNMSSLIKGLKKYQEEGKLMRDARSGYRDAADKLKALRDKGFGRTSPEDLLATEPVVKVVDPGVASKKTVEEVAVENKTESVDTTPEKKTDSQKMKQNTDYVFGIMTDSTTTFEESVKSRLKLYTETTERSKQPAIVIFESDPSRRDAMKAKISEFQEKYPGATFEYVPLPDTDKSELINMTQEEYIKKILNEKRIEAGIGSDVIQGVQSGLQSSLFKKEETA